MNILNSLFNLIGSDGMKYIIQKRQKENKEWKKLYKKQEEKML